MVVKVFFLLFMVAGGYFDLLDELVKGISIVRYLAPGCLGLII